MLEDHNRWTGSKRARELLDNWAASRGKFVKVFPTEYKRALSEMYERKVLEEAATPAVTAPETKAVAAK
jgi:glutamate synthase domain-containing protein 3